jgi:hypothetical protein
VLIAFARAVPLNQLKYGDEGLSAVAAANICQDVRFALRPSYLPGGSPDWPSVDAGHIFYPPLSHVLQAVALCPTQDVRASYVAPLLALLASAAAMFAVLRPVSTRGAWLAALLVLGSPAMSAQFEALEAEPIAAALGAWAIVCALGASRSGRATPAALSGMLLGLAFITKPWLCLPSVLGVIAALLSTRRRIPLLAVASLTGVVATGAHLAFVAWWSPHDLPFWLRNVYLTMFFEPDAQGDKWSGATVPAGWVHPVWYYGAILYREHFFLLPLLAAGLPSLLRAARGGETRRVAIVLAAVLFGILLLSLPAVKEPLYVLSAVPAAYAFTAMALDAIGPSETSAAIRRAGLVAVLGTVSIAAAYARGVKRDDIDLNYVALHAIGMAAAFALTLGVCRFKPRFLVLAGAMCLAFVCGDAIATWRRTRASPLRALADRIRPFVAGRPPYEASFVSPRYHLLTAYLFREGRYWTSFYQELDGDEMERAARRGELCAFITDEELRRNPAVAAIEVRLRPLLRDVGDDLPPRLRGDYHVLGNPACVPSR